MTDTQLPTHTPPLESLWRHLSASHLPPLSQSPGLWWPYLNPKAWRRRANTPWVLTTPHVEGLHTAPARHQRPAQRSRGAVSSSRASHNNSLSCSWVGGCRPLAEQVFVQGCGADWPNSGCSGRQTAQVVFIDEQLTWEGVGTVGVTRWWSTHVVVIAERGNWGEQDGNCVQQMWNEWSPSFIFVHFSMLNLGKLFHIFYFRRTLASLLLTGVMWNIFEGFVNIIVIYIGCLDLLWKTIMNILGLHVYHYICMSFNRICRRRSFHCMFQPLYTT